MMMNNEIRVCEMENKSFAVITKWGQFEDYAGLLVLRVGDTLIGFDSDNPKPYNILLWDLVGHGLPHSPIANDDGFTVRPVPSGAVNFSVQDCEFYL